MVNRKQAAVLVVVGLACLAAFVNRLGPVLGPATFLLGLLLSGAIVLILCGLE